MIDRFIYLDILIFGVVVLMNKKTKFYEKQIIELFKAQGYKVIKPVNLNDTVFELRHSSCCYFLSVLWRPGGKLLKKDLNFIDNPNSLILVDDTDKNDIKYTVWFDSSGSFVIEDDKVDDEIWNLDEVEYIRGKPESMSLDDWLKNADAERKKLLASIELDEKLKISADTPKNRLYYKHVVDMFLEHGFKIRKTEQEYPFFDVIDKDSGECSFSVLWRTGGKLVPEDMDYTRPFRNLVLVDDSNLDDIKYTVWFSNGGLNVIDDDTTEEDLRKMDDWKYFRKKLVSVSLEEWMNSSAIELHQKFDK